MLSDSSKYRIRCTHLSMDRPISMILLALVYAKLGAGSSEDPDSPSLSQEQTIVSPTTRRPVLVMDGNPS
jgi:hypothetical protein